MENFFTRSDGIKIELIPDPFCDWCSKPIAKQFQNYGYCFDCHNRLEPPLLKIRSVGIYMLKTAETQLSNEIWELKSDPSLADKLGECMVYVINERYQYLREMDIIVSVPSGDAKRGYNQSELLARYVSEKIGIPCNDILYKKEEYIPQHLTPLESKENNIKNKIGCKEKIVGKNVLLIDDAYITGDTKNECARALKKCGAENITCLVIGRAVDKTNMDYIKSLDEDYE